MPTGRRHDPKVAASPECNHRLGKENVTVQALPNSDISYAVSFKDGKNHNLYGIGQANANGKFIWTFSVPADAAYGKATVLIGASSPNGGGGSTDSFEVAMTGC